MNRFIFSMISFLVVPLIWAQEGIEIRGQIVDSKSQEPMAAVLVLIQDSNISTLTAEDGTFLISQASEGTSNLVLTYTGYITKRLTVNVEDKQGVDLGLIVMEEDFSAEAQMSLISLTDNDLGDDNSGSETTSGLLQATRDVFQQAAAFNWGQARFRIRGLDNEYGRTLINGIVMNKIYDGRPQWGNWGGLNDVTRSQEFSMGSSPSDYLFGGILGTQAISTRASHIRKGSRVSASAANTNYKARGMATYASGLNSEGWAYAFSASYRGAEEGHFEGTDYDAKSFFLAIEKKFNANHSLNFTGIYAQNKRGKSAPMTDEVADLMGYKYNSYWGWQDGKKRNSREKVLEEPIFMLTHYWKMNDKSSLTSSLAYQFGKIGNSRLNYNRTNNPDPTYYKNLPSYFSTYHDRDDNYLGGTPEYKGYAETQRGLFLENSQIDWDEIYRENAESVDANGLKDNLVMLYEDRTDDKTLSFNTNFKSAISDQLTFVSGLNYIKLNSTNYGKILDLLGSDYFLDLDRFATGQDQQTDLNNPDRKLKEGDKFKYNYELDANVLNVFTQFEFKYDRVAFYLGQNIGYTTYQRNGLFRNGMYPNSSYGKSEKVDFNSFGFKGGATYYLTGRHALNANIAFMNQAPNLRNVFANARVNNTLVDGLDNETIFSVDGSYILRTPKLKARLTGYFSEIKNATEISFFYAQGLGLIGEDGELMLDGNAFVAEILTGIEKRNVGLEFGAEYQVTQTLKAIGNVAFGQSFYINNPNIALSIDNAKKIVNYGQSFLENYRVSGGPQTATSLGLEYRSPQYWWVGANVNYLANNYLDVSPIMRTSMFTVNAADPDQFPYEDMTPESVRELLKQEKLQDFTLFNLSGGKSWRLPNRNIIGFFASINNVFDKKFKTGGFEQGRNANYKEVTQDYAGGTRSFGNKYFYGYGRNFFANVYYSF